MTFEMWVTLGILALAIVLFVSERLRVDVVALGVVIILMATQLITTEQAIAGFSSTTVISIAALFIVGGAVFQTGLAAMIGDRILKIAGTDERRLLVVLMIAVAIMSAFISSTGVMALMLPAMVSLSNRSGIAASRLLMPVAFASLLGGALTLIGTPPNIVVSETLTNAGKEPFAFFSFTPLGTALLVTIIGFMLAFGKRLLPDRRPEKTIQQMETPAELFKLYELPGSLYRLRVRSRSPLIGKTIGELTLRDDFDINIISITRTVRNGTERAVTQQPQANLALQRDDVLVVQGKGNDIGRAAGFWNLAIMANEPVVEDDIITNEVGIAEVLLRPRSSLLDRTLKDVRFGSTHHLTVLDIIRPGTEGKLNLKDTPLKFGDILLVQGEWKNIFALKRLRHDFIVMGEPEAAEMGAFSRPRYAPVTLVIMALMVLAIVFNIASLTLASLTAAVALVLTGCLTMDEAYEAIDWKSLVLIAGMLPMSTAMVQVGLVDVIAGGMTDTLGDLGPMFALAGLFLLTAVFTQVLSNTVTTVLLAPIALTLAGNFGVQPEAFLMGVAIAASMAFASPVASPVNTLVMSAGNYRFSDYLRIGVPMILLAFVVSMIVLPLLWAF